MFGDGPWNLWAVACFLGWQTLPRRFILDYSSIAAPHTVRTRTIILTIVDRFSKMARFVLLPKLRSAKETPQILLNHVFCLHGIPVDVVLDRGALVLFCVLARALQISSHWVFHRKASGRPKIMNQEMETALHNFRNPLFLSQQLLWVAHNTLTSSATGLSRLQCAYGYHPPLFPALEKKVSCLVIWEGYGPKDRFSFFGPAAPLGLSSRASWSALSEKGRKPSLPSGTYYLFSCCSSSRSRRRPRF